MKKLIFFFGFLFTVNISACKCNFQSFGESFAQNAFVAEVEILKIYDIKNDEDERFYKADIKILKLYKGKAISSILVRGKVGEIFGPACEIAVKTGDQFLIYLNPSDGFGMSACTSKKKLDDKNIDEDRKALDFLIKNKIDNTNVFYFSGDYFKKFKKEVPKNNFAVYQLNVNSKSKVESISAIQNFGTEKDSEILNVIKEKFTILRDFMSEVKNEKVVLVLFFNRENADVISNFNGNIY